MTGRPQAPTDVVISFVDCINRGDLDGLVALMTDDHTLIVLDEAPIVGRDANRSAWNDYFSAYPNYMIHPRHIAASGDVVALLGATTGSHLALPDKEETKLHVVWLAETVGDRVSVWRVAEDTPRFRAYVGIPRDL